jgi:hypothetical protein
MSGKAYATIKLAPKRIAQHFAIPPELLRVQVGKGRELPDLSYRGVGNQQMKQILVVVVSTAC